MADVLDIFGDGRAVIIQGDVRAALREMPAGSVQCVITSPPYWGLRAYGTEPQVWGGDAACAHEWRGHIQPAANGIVAAHGMTGSTISGSSATRRPRRSSFCRLCGAWRGELGLEPTPALYVEHLVEVFREVRRVMREDATLWINLGDTYAMSSMRGNSPFLGVVDQSQSGITDCKRSVPSGLKPKDLCEIPSDVVRALRADGWWLRSRIPWLKRNAMPESTTDRPATAMEYVFLLAKSARYFYDREAVKVPQSRLTFERFAGGKRKRKVSAKDCDREQGRDLANSDYKTRCPESILPGGRARRNSDWFFESWQGLLSGDDGEPLALIVNPAAFKGAHFATFPPKLVEPMVKAGTSERGCCPKCGAPWRRVVEKAAYDAERGRATGKAGQQDEDAAARRLWERTQAMRDATGEHDTCVKSPRTLGWQPGCGCESAIRNPQSAIPCTVLDPFAGSGTTLGVACQLGRRAIGIELKDKYVQMATDRIRGMIAPATAVRTGADDAPLFAAMKLSDDGPSPPLARREKGVPVACVGEAGALSSPGRSRARVARGPRSVLRADDRAVSRD